MPKQEKRVRDLRRTPKDFPVIRKVIQEQAWIPLVLCDTNGAYWDGLTGIDKNGRIQNAMSDSQRRQMINMIHDGYFGGEVLDALVDQNRHMKIRDDLIDRPDNQVIAREALRIMQFQPTNSRE
jgi:hypothetical protein